MSTIRTVDRAFSILRHLSQHPGGLGVTEISAELSLAKSTISRLLATMEQWEVVERTEDNRFRIGAEPVRWISQQTMSQTLVAMARPTLQAIAEETGEAVALCVRDGLQVMYLDHVQSYQDIQVRNWTGERLPLHVTSSGKVLLAWSSAETIDMVLSQPLLPYTAKTVTNSNVLRRRLSRIRDLGYDIANEEHGEGVIGITVPIINRHGDVDAVLNLYGPHFRLDSAELQQQIVELLKTGAAGLMR